MLDIYDSFALHCRMLIMGLGICGVFGTPGLAHGQTPDEQIIKLVTAAQEALFVRGQLQPYLDQWTEDAVLINGRTEAAGPYDIRLNRDQIESSRARFEYHPPFKKMSFHEVRVVVEGNEASLSWTVMNTPGRLMVETSDEIYKLRKVDGSWKVYLNRVWPRSETQGVTRVVFDQAHWDRQDRAVDAARETGQLSTVSRALINARRLKEVVAVLKDIPKEEMSMGMWIRLAIVANAIGDTENAERAVCEGRRAGGKVRAFIGFSRVICP